MAIQYGGSTRAADFGSGNSNTTSSPSVSGANTLGVVALFYRTAGGVFLTQNPTWNGVAMTDAPAATTFNGTIRVGIFYIVNPPAGVSNVAINTGSNWGAMFANIAYFTGVNQSNPFDASGESTSGSATTFSGTTQASGANNLVIETAVVIANNTPSPTSPSSQLQSGANGTEGWSSAYQIAAAANPAMKSSSAAAGSWTWGWASFNAAPTSSGFMAFF